MTLPLHPMLAENSLFHLIGQIFHPIFVAVAYVLAGIYAVIPNYAIAIVLLTILIMALLTPLTVKSTKSMLLMQQIQPEIKKLQQKYKGSENRAQLNEEMMRLYRERGVNPAGGCLPMFLQMPFLIVLYDVIEGLSNTVVVHGQTVAEPRYIPQGSRMYTDLVHSAGAMKAFGMNLALKPFSHHDVWYAYIPFFAMVAIAVVLQYVQMSQMNKRNTAAAQANPQIQTMQKVMPIIFAYIYFIIPAAVVIYMVVSTLIRIITQDIIFRTGIVQRPGERVIPAGDGAPRPKGLIGAMSALVEDKAKPKEREREEEQTRSEERDKGAAQAGKAARGGGNGATTPRPSPRKPAPRRGAGGAPASSGQKSGNVKGATPGGSAPKPHPRAKSKRTRRAR